MIFVKNKSFHLFFISFLIYIFLNLIENYIHYNIGRNRESNYIIEFSNPSALDWSKIAVVMVVFALLQGILTILIEGYWDST